MKKTIGLVILLLVALVAFAVPVAAQTASSTDEVVQEVRPTLAIKAPQTASVGEKVQIKVVALPGGAPVGGAGVWAVDINRSDDLTSASTSELDRIGIFMGWTDTTGVLGCVFQDVSKYLLVSCKDKYNPGFAWIKIQPPKEMTIRNPESVLVYEPVSIRVVEKSVMPVETPVPGAGVWAVNYINTLDSLTNQDAVAAVGIFLGWTDQEGYVSPKPYFTNPGQYYLVAFKAGFVPAISKIRVDPLKEMTIRNPETVQVLERVSIRVVEISVMPVETPVPGAGVWAVPYINTLASLTDYDAVAAVGIFLGWTDKEGYVSPKPYFTSPGQYYLIAFKTGFVPAVSKITVKPLKEMAITGPETAYTGQTCEFTVSETNGGAAVAGAGVWAILNQNQAELASLDDKAADVITSRGIFLGWTNNQGQVFHAFDKAGQYILVAAKQGYKPAFSKISILEVKELAIRNPETVRILAAGADQGSGKKYLNGGNSGSRGWSLGNQPG